MKRNLREILYNGGQRGGNRVEQVNTNHITSCECFNIRTKTLPFSSISVPRIEKTSFLDRKFLRARSDLEIKSNVQILTLKIFTRFNRVLL